MNKTLTLLFTTSILNYVHANNIPETPALTNQLMGAYQTQYNDFNDDDSANFAEEDSSSIADNHMPEETQPQGTISLPINEWQYQDFSFTEYSPAEDEYSPLVIRPIAIRCKPENVQQPFSNQTLPRLHYMNQGGIRDLDKLTLSPVPKGLNQTYPNKVESPMIVSNQPSLLIEHLRSLHQEGMLENNTANSKDNPIDSATASDVQHKNTVLAFGAQKTTKPKKKSIFK